MRESRKINEIRNYTNQKRKIEKKRIEKNKYKQMKTWTKSIQH